MPLLRFLTTFAQTGITQYIVPIVLNSSVAEIGWTDETPYDRGFRDLGIASSCWPKLWSAVIEIINFEPTNLNPETRRLFVGYL